MKPLTSNFRWLARPWAVLADFGWLLLFPLVTLNFSCTDFIWICSFFFFETEICWFSSGRRIFRCKVFNQKLNKQFFTRDHEATFGFGIVHSIIHCLCANCPVMLARNVENFYICQDQKNYFAGVDVSDCFGQAFAVSDEQKQTSVIYSDLLRKKHLIWIYKKGLWINLYLCMKSRRVSFYLSIAFSSKNENKIPSYFSEIDNRRANVYI